jgi:cell division protein FtsB
MSDAYTQEKFEHLRRSVRRWKTLALTLLVGLGLVIVLATGAAVLWVQRARQAEEAARQAEMDAREQAERVRQVAEDALREAR